MPEQERRNLLRDDVYRRPLETALDRLGVSDGWKCVDAGAGGGDVSVALAEIVGATGRIYSVDIDPVARDEVASRAAAYSQVIAITQAAEDLLLPEPVDLAFCRFLLMHVHDPLVVVCRMASAVRPGGFVVAQEPVTSAGRIGGLPFSMEGALHPDAGDVLPSLICRAGLELVDCWAESPAWAGEGPVARYLERLTGVDPGNDPVILPPLVTAVGRVPENRPGDSRNNIPAAGRPTDW
ncbi:MAG: methyltransferase domain-containing protein [Actinobacteria bacterium]|nr:methyltransferase domain-containing protein [Actinomycetota bacterium]MCL5446264.1 methyltransferase domain-containing protein [Actinomycetota bacterium]